MPNQRVCPAEAAKILGVMPGTLAIWRCYKKGPRYLKIQGKVWYNTDDLEAYANSKAVETVDSRPPQLRPVKNLSKQ